MNKYFCADKKYMVFKKSNFTKLNKNASFMMALIYQSYI